MEFMKKVEEISKKVGDTASNTYNTVADKSGKLIEETKLKISIFYFFLSLYNHHSLITINIKLFTLSV